MAIDSINGFERSMLDAWTEVYDCWEREFITRLWNIELDHHTSNSEITQTKPVKTMHNHQHPFVPLSMMTAAAMGGDTKWNMVTPMKAVMSCPGHLEKLMNPVCIQYRVFNVAHLARHFRTDVKALCQWLCAAIEAVGIKQVVISAVMADPTLNGNDSNTKELAEINRLREKNDILLFKVENAYGIYSDVENMKNKKEYDEEIALHELQPNKYSNEDQLNMSSSLQTESDENKLSAELSQGGIDIEELKPWNHIDQLSENRVQSTEIPLTKACNKFDKVIQTIAGFESMLNLDDNGGQTTTPTKSENATAPATTPKSSATAPTSPSKNVNAVMIAGEVFNGKSLSQKQMATMEIGMAMGNKYPADIMAVYNAQKGKK